jgi:hypothetical protein
VGRANSSCAWTVPVKRNRFIKLVGADKSVNRTVEAKARALAGIKGYVWATSPTCPTRARSS